MKYKLLLPLILLFSCVDDIDDISDIDLEGIKNRPVISNTGNVYSFIVNADDFSFVDEGILDMDSASIVSLVVDGYASGGLRFSVFDQDSTVIFDRELSDNVVISQFPSFSARSYLTSFENFSGRVTISLTEDD